MVSTDMQPAFSPRANGAAVPARQGGSVVAFPSLEFGQNPVQAKTLAAPGTGFRVLLSWIPLLAVTLTTFGTIWIMAAIANWLLKKKIHALIKGQGVQISADQLPEIHKIVSQFAQRLGMKKTPEIFLVEDSTQNAAAVKLGNTDIILLTDDLVWGALQSGDPRTLGYALGHELAHVALGHNSMVRTIRRRMFPSLSRLDEFTADNVAAALVGDKQVAVKGITLLTVGPQLLPFINPAAMEKQAREVWGNKQSKKAEQGMTHPLLFRRIANVLGAQW
jgi:Zn-dependent protease with chaperone function